MVSKPAVILGLLASFGAARSALGLPDANKAAILFGLIASLGTGASATLACPANNNTDYIAANGAVFYIECGTDRGGGDLSSATASSYQACIELCSTTVTCVDVSWTGGTGTSGTCYMKKIIESATIGAATGVYGARQLYSATTSGLSPTATSAGTLRCPGSNGTTYSDSYSSTALVECFLDRAGGDGGFALTYSLDACMNICGFSTGCVAVAWAYGSPG